jgi:glycosyltransferase involved in cell wall biosynthesis
MAHPESRARRILAPTARQPSRHEGSPEDAIRLSEPAASAMPAPAPDAPRLSILVPTWNAEATVERAVDSILAERSIPLEVIVVDDASTDDTAGIVTAVAARDPRVVLLRLRVNGGVSNARNRGLALVRGEWVAFLDADDVLLPGALDALMAPTRDPGVRSVIGQRIQNDGERRWISKGYDNADVRLPGRKSIATHPSLMYYAAIHGKLFHRSLLRDLEFEGRVLGDQPWTIRALLRAGDGIEVIDQTVYEWTYPHPDRWVATITSTSRSSAAKGAEMVGMAPVVFRSVSDEVDLVVADLDARRAIKQAYFERLIRSDVSVAVRNALGRRDPGTARLLTAIGAFLESVPGEIVATSTALVGHVLLSPARHWDTLVRSARPSYWALLAVAVRAGPATGHRSRGWWAVRALVAVEHIPPPVGPSLASAVLSLVARARRLVVWLRRTPRG